jgi:glycosyltransferase involved in cell wall biosynthesis
MKITFLYAYDGEEWSTPMAIVKEFQLRGWQTEIVSIGSNKTGSYHDLKLQRWLELKPQTDIVMFLDWGRFDSPYLDKALLPNAFWIQESGDDPQNFERNFPKSNRFHYTITPSKQSAEEYRNRGINAEWINHFADTMVQFPMNIESKYVAVTTRGFGNSEFLDYLTNWAEGAVGNRNGLNAEEHTKFLNSGLMVIQNSRWKEITRRIFEGMACGKLVITDRLSAETGLSEMFIEGEDIVYYDEMFDCIEKMNYYNENEEERERIAHNGMMKVLHNYTQIQVVDKLLNQYNKFIK